MARHSLAPEVVHRPGISGRVHRTFPRGALLFAFADSVITRRPGLVRLAMNIIGISGLHSSVAFKRREFPGLPDRFYRMAQGYDAAASLITDAGVAAAAAEERFTREKTTGSFPALAIRYCLSAQGISPDEVDYVAHGFSYEPFATCFEADDFSRRRYEEVYAPGAQREHVLKCFPSLDFEERFIPVPHHLAHAASAFYLSGFPEALIFISDGMGEVDSMTIALGRGREIEVVARVSAQHSLGTLYGVFTHYLGFLFAMDEYKVMGLAPYGNPRRHFNDIMDLVDLKDDGTYTVPVFGEDRSVLEKETHAGVLRRLEERFGPPREPGGAITQHHKDIAASLQAALQACHLHVLRHFRRELGQQNVCMAGGVALNCTANGMISRSGLFDRVFVQPVAGDDGAAIGAALYVDRQYRERSPARMGLPLWGPAFGDGEIRSMLEKRDDCSTRRYDSFPELCREVARRLADGQIVAWFQGRMEFGPRALGSRSILADPRDPEMRDRINSLVKKRESFRPFAPAVLEEAATKYFHIEPDDADTYAHMLFTVPVRTEYRDRLPAITHVDGSARVQTVSRRDHPRFWTLITEFEKVTDCPLLLNTSFNIKGQPIVCTPEEALDTFLFAKLDTLVLENHLVSASPRTANDADRERLIERIRGTLVR